MVARERGDGCWLEVWAGVTRSWSWTGGRRIWSSWRSEWQRGVGGGRGLAMVVDHGSFEDGELVD